MSIKDLFNNPGVPKIQKSVTSDEMVETVESEDYVEAKRKEFEQFIPPIDFSDPSNFAKFGSAELYYEKAFERIHNNYPYDGTLAEKVEFENSSSYLDKYVFDNLYPRTNGYVTFDGNQTIEIFGGPHTASAGMEGKALDSTFDKSMIYDESKRRDVAFEYKAEYGCTIEFWLKKDEPSPVVRQRIVDITNDEAGTVFQIDYLRNGSDDILQLYLQSGSVTPARLEVISDATNGEWSHFSISIYNENNETFVESYRNGHFIKKDQPLQGGSPVEILDITAASSGMKMVIGGDFSGTASRKLIGSLDEFRFWKVRRTPEQIFNNWFTQIGGGTNKHDANLNLGLYLKFNEGITGIDAVDSKVLDYSGRINNGTVSGYTSSFRNTGSAITEALGQPEFMDPIIYSFHPDVVSTKTEYKQSGSIADLSNTSQIFSYFPGWMQEEDEQEGKQLKYLSQVIGSYFDTLWHQISFVDKIHDNHYISGSNKSLPFAKKLLYDRGFVMPDLFVDATITENFKAKDDNEVYEKQINEVRNTIYHNIYNNLDTIYKSKGTEKAFRNFFRSLGIGEDLVKLNMYADDSTFVLRDNYQYKSLERNYVNFNRYGNFGATLYQSSSNGNYYIPGDKNHLGSFTFETELILPRKQKKNEVDYLPFPSVTSSVAGFHTTGSAYDYPLSNDLGMSIYVLKNNADVALSTDETQTIRFMLTGAFGELISDEFAYQYENNKWNLAVRMKHESYPYVNVDGIVDDKYSIEFYGVEADGNTKRQSFSLSVSDITTDYFSSDKIFYAGAERLNYSGSVLNSTDIRLGSVRYWHSYLSDEAIDKHAYDPETFGANNPQRSDLFDTYSIEIPREKTLALHWAFNTLNGSDSFGEMIIPDLSSESTVFSYGDLQDTIGGLNEAKGIEFNISDSKSIDKNFLHVARKRLPDNLMSSDLTIIKSEETENFFVDEDVSDNFYAFEKSMYGVISEEMLNLFSTAVDMNNLIGQPNQKYHHRYNLMDFMRDRFFDDVQNEPDIEKFTSFYKWIDDSISIALQQLIPASARFSEKINNIIESHVLERNKYVHQLPILTTFESTEGSIKGIMEMKYDWKHGHAPSYPEEEQNNVLWQRERKEKDGLRESLRVSRNNHSLQSSGITRKDIDGSTYLSDTYALRRFAKTHDLSVSMNSTIHAGTNFGRNKNLYLFHDAVAPAGSETLLGAPSNIITVGLDEGSDIIEETRNEDMVPRKKKFEAIANVQKHAGSDYIENLKSNFILPMNLVSGTVHTGYNNIVKQMFRSDVIFSNLHNDITHFTNDVPMQGPFTEAHVGGLQYRHIDINRYDESKSNIVEVDMITSYPTGTLEFDIDVLASKYAAGTGSWVRVRDADGSSETFRYAPYYDFKDNQWSSIEELSSLITHKLDVFANEQSPSILELTQSTYGSYYNSTITTSANNFITASGFAGGLAPSTTPVERNLDSRGQRPEGWGLLFKTHVRLNDEDGAFGFVGADYGSPYPYPYFAKATRYREEHAKRPINTKNIKTFENSRKAGNYKNELDLFQISSEHQKTWALEASNDPNVDILPQYYADNMPSTTHYQSLVSKKATEYGNVFNSLKSSLAIEETRYKRYTLEFSSDRTYEYIYDASVSGYPDILQKTFSFWFKFENTSTSTRFLMVATDSSGNQSTQIYFSNNLLYFKVYNTSGSSKEWRFAVDYNQFLNKYTNLIITWTGSSTTVPNVYIDTIPVSLTSESIFISFTQIRPIDRIYIGDYPIGSTSYELNATIILAAIWVNYAASGTDLTAMFNNGIPPLIPHQTTNLVDYWLFGEGLKDTYKDGDLVDITATTISSSYGFGENHMAFNTSFSGRPIVIFREVYVYNADTNPAEYSTPNIIATPRTDLTGSQRNINTRFSAPGGVEIQTISYLDAYSQTYSAHNAMPFRNLSVLGSGSGEEGTIRVEDHLGLRRGLKTLRGLHMGKFGLDSQYGDYSSNHYPVSGSYNKQHLNTSHRMEWNSSTDVGISGVELITGSTYDNSFINTPIPRSDLQYSWIHDSISGSQNILGYAPPDGMVSSSLGWVEAIVFPSGSSIFAD